MNLRNTYEIHLHKSYLWLFTYCVKRWFIEPNAGRKKVMDIITPLKMEIYFVFLVGISKLEHILLISLWWMSNPWTGSVLNKCIGFAFSSRRHNKLNSVKCIEIDRIVLSLCCIDNRFGTSGVWLHHLLRRCTTQMVARTGLDCRFFSLKFWYDYTVL